jgi:hypothetical protein
MAGFRVHMLGPSTSSHVALDLQKRNKKAHFVMLLSSDHAECVRLTIVTKSPEYAVPTYEKTLCMDGAQSWQFCSFWTKRFALKRSGKFGRRTWQEPKKNLVLSHFV